MEAVLDAVITSVAKRTSRQRRDGLGPSLDPLGHLRTLLHSKPSASSSNRLASVALMKVIPVTLAPGRFRSAMIPAVTGTVLRQKWSRGQVEARFANMSPCLIGMEACLGAHHLISVASSRRWGMMRG